jgi:hypothetical protein
MAVKTDGTISVQNIVDEFGGTAPHSVSEYYRGGSLVPVTPNTGRNNNIPTGGTIRHSNFYNSSKTVVVTYDIIGGGGCGGGGFANGGGTGRSEAGGATSISTFSVSAAGGTGGRNGVINGTSGSGEGTIYGPGGAGVPRTASDNDSRPGNPAPSTSYGAGGGGGGGDNPQTYDNSGAAGEGGFAGQRLTGTITVNYGSTVNFTVGGGGTQSGGESNRKGGRGANGLVKISYEGVNRTFTSSGSTVIN